MSWLKGWVQTDNWLSRVFKKKEKRKLSTDEWKEVASQIRGQREEERIKQEREYKINQILNNE
jgi:hypothetical protein